MGDTRSEVWHTQGHGRRRGTRDARGGHVRCNSVHGIFNFGSF